MERTVGVEFEFKAWFCPLISCACLGRLLDLSELLFPLLQSGKSNVYIPGVLWVLMAWDTENFQFFKVNYLDFNGKSPYVCILDPIFLRAVSLWLLPKVFLVLLWSLWPLLLFFLRLLNKFLNVLLIHIWFPQQAPPLRWFWTLPSMTKTLISESSGLTLS